MNAPGPEIANHGIQENREDGKQKRHCPNTYHETHETHELTPSPNKVRLDSRNKRLMDVLKVIARNAFYKALAPFKQNYDNYRRFSQNLRSGIC